MAALFRTPKAPPPQVIYQPVPQPVPAPAPAPAPEPPPSATPPAPEPAPAPPPQPAAAPTADPSADGALPEDPVAARVALLQRRQRGRSGTIATAWTGIMTPRAALPQRKQLLGE